MEYDSLHAKLYFDLEILNFFKYEPEKACEIFRKVTLHQMEYEEAWDVMYEVLGGLLRYRDEVLKCNVEDVELEKHINWNDVYHGKSKVSELPEPKRIEVIEQQMSNFRNIYFDLIDRKRREENLEYRKVVKLTKVFVEFYPNRVADLLILLSTNPTRKEKLNFLLDNMDKAYIAKISDDDK